MWCPAAVAGHVHGGGCQACVLERLVDRDGLGREVLFVHVEDRVQDRAARARCPDRRERGAVLDESPLGAVVPDQVRDPVNVRMGAGRDRAQADRRQRREHRHAAAVRAVLREERERRCGSGGDSVLEHVRREAVDDDQDQLLAH